MISQSLEDKVRATEELIKKFHKENDGNIFVSFSGGKDSTVLRHIALNIFPDLKVVFSNTTNELLEVYQFVKSFGDSVIWVHPTITFQESVKKHGFPLVSKEVAHLVFQLKNINTPKTKTLRMYGNAKGTGKVPAKWKFLAEQPFDMNNKCCQRLKKDPLEKWSKKNGMKPMIAIMSDESNLRKQLSLYGSENGSKLYPFLRSGWREEDIWEYAKKHNIRFAECYYDRIVNGQLLKGETRTGCEYCGFGIHLDGAKRFMRSKLLTPKRYKKMMSLENNGVKFSEAIDMVMKGESQKEEYGLYGYEILSVDENDQNKIIHTRLLHEKMRNCSCGSTNVRPFGTKTYKYIDVPVESKFVEVHVTSHNYVCDSCYKVSHPFFPFMNDCWKMTDRLVEYIKDSSRSAEDISKETGVDKSVLKEFF